MLLHDLCLFTKYGLMPMLAVILTLHLFTNYIHFNSVPYKTYCLQSIGGGGSFGLMAREREGGGEGGDMFWGCNSFRRDTTTSTATTEEQQQKFRPSDGRLRPQRKFSPRPL